VSQFVRSPHPERSPPSRVAKPLVSKRGEVFQTFAPSLKIKSPYNIKCLVVLPNLLLSVPRMYTSSVSPKSAFLGLLTSVTRTFPKPSSVRSFRATSQTTVCPPSALSARVTCSTMSISCPSSLMVPNRTSFPIGPPPSPRWSFSSVVR